MVSIRSRYAQAFGGVDLNDPLYESVTTGRRYQGMEHWLPLFHDKLVSLADYMPLAAISLDHLAEEAAISRRDQIEEYYNARKQALKEQSFGAAPYKPLPPDALFLTDADWKAITAFRAHFFQSLFVLHTKMLFFVDDEKAQIAEFDFFAQHGMSADENINVAAGSPRCHSGAGSS